MRFEASDRVLREIRSPKHDEVLFFFLEEQCFLAGKKCDATAGQTLQQSVLNARFSDHYRAGHLTRTLEENCNLRKNVLTNLLDKLTLILYIKNLSHVPWFNLKLRRLNNNIKSWYWQTNKQLLSHSWKRFKVWDAIKSIGCCSEPTNANVLTMTCNLCSQ